MRSCYNSATYNSLVEQSHKFFRDIIKTCYICVMRFFLTAIFFGCFASTALAQIVNIQCESVKAIGYRESRNIPDEWSDEGGFNTGWNFSYDVAKDIAFLDGKKVFSFPGNGTVIIIEYSANQQSQSLWSYALHLATKRVTASQVNVYETNITGEGLKSRSVQLSCK